MSDELRTAAGDFLRALRVLDANADASVARIAALLGVAWLPIQDAPAAPPPPSPPPPPPARPVVTQEPPPVATVSETRVDPAAAVIPSTLTPLTATATPVAPAWLKQLEPLLPSHGTDAVIEASPLLRPGQYRGILSTLLSTTGRHGPLNLEQVVRAITRGDVVRVVPRRPTSTMAHGIQLLIDGSEAMAPFSGDVARLERDIARLCGDAALDLVDFSRSPLRGAGRRTDDEWQPYGATQITASTEQRPLVPAEGTRVVCVTDLGIGRMPGMTSAGTQEWLRFSRVVRQAGCPLVFLVPYKKTRWPAVLRRTLSIVHWDPATTAAVVARAVRGRGWRRRSSW